jgi:tetratricopeptide (TPR) repeat protein
MTRLLVVCFALLRLQGPPAIPVQPAADEDAVRAAVQQYFDAQAKKDPDAALAIWSTSASPRLTREAFVSSFGPGEDTFAVEIQSVKIDGAQARVRLGAVRTRLIQRDGLPPVTSRMTFQNAQLWRKEGTAWKLLRDGPFAEDFADALLAASPADQARLMAENPDELNASLRRVLGDRASMAAMAQNYQRARTIFELVLAVARAAHDQRGESETLQNVANAYYYLRDYAAATDFYQRRLRLSKEMDDPEATAASLVGLATVAYVRGEYSAALASYREALEIYEKREEGAAIGRTLVSVGNVQYLQAEYDAATASYRRALALLIEGMDTQGASFARAGLARVLAAQGDIAAALDMYGQVLTDARTQASFDPRLKNGVATTLESIGELYFRLGITDRARASFEEGRQLADADPEFSARLFGRLGITELVAGRFDVALTDYTSSRARYELAKNQEGVAHAWVGIGYSHTAREKYPDAVTAYKTAIRMFESLRLNEDSGRAWLGLSLAHWGAKDYGASLETAQKVRGIADAIDSQDLRWRSGVRAGEALRKLSRLDEAKRSFQDAIAAIDRIAADAPTTPDARGQLDDSASAWTGLAFTLAAQADAAGALAAAEGRLAHLRRVQLAAFQRDITRGATAEEQAEELAIVRDLISTRAQLRAERNAPRPDQSRIERLQQQLTASLGKRAEQQARLYARVPALMQWRGLSQPATDLNALVPDGRSVLVEYVIGDDDLLVLSVVHGDTAADVSAKLVTINRRDLAETVSQALQPATLADATAWRDTMAPLAKAVLDAVALAIGDRQRLTIVPDDLLWKVPFEALPLGDADLGARVSVTYATSFATLAVERAMAAAGPKPEHVTAGLLAAPAVPAPVRAQMMVTQPGWKEPDGDAARTLAASLAKAFPDDAGVLRTAAEATESAARALLESADVVYLAAPLQVSVPVPLFTSVLVGGEEKGEPANDGRWEAREWFAANGRARLLIVPDASSFGAAGIGAAMDAIAWAAAAGGVPALVLGRWPADGFTTDALLTALHAELAKGAAVSDAWTAAVTAARAKSATPSGWAGLRLIGG